MSNYKTKAKRPDGKKWEDVYMLDNFFGLHNYGVQFPDDKVYPEEQCEIKSNKKQWKK